ncbi:unnamed protein product [Sphagnum balticum]
MDPLIIFDPAKHVHLIPSLVDLHITCITQPTYTIVSFVPPLNPDLMTKWWEARAQEAAQEKRYIIIQLGRRIEGEGKEVEEVAGVVMLGLSMNETVRYNAMIEKLLVHPRYRGKGLARKLMERLELLDTEKDSPAELIYPKLGYTKIIRDEILALVVTKRLRLQGLRRVMNYAKNYGGGKAMARVEDVRIQRQDGVGVLAPITGGFLKLRGICRRWDWVAEPTGWMKKLLVFMMERIQSMG